jgi:hypothetical protein
MLNYDIIVQVILPKFVILGKSIPSPNSSQLQNISYQNTPDSEELCTMVLASFKQFVCRDSYNQSFPRPLDCRISLSLYPLSLSLVDTCTALRLCVLFHRLQPRHSLRDRLSIVREHCSSLES